MQSSFRRKVRFPSPAMLVALLALFVALGGSAFAVSRVGTKQLKKNAVTTAKIRNGAVTSAKLGSGSVTGAKVRANSVGGSKLADGSIGGPKLVDGAIGESAMAADSVGQTQLIDGSVTAEKIAAPDRLALKGALAYGLVDFAGPSLVTGSTSGFSGVARSGPGIYCLTPTPEVAALAFGPAGNPVRPMLVSVEWARTPSSVEYPFALPNGSARGSCSPGQYEVHTESPTGTPSNEISFVVAIP